MLLILEIALGIVLGYIIIINLELVIKFALVFLKYFIVGGFVSGLLLGAYYFISHTNNSPEPTANLALDDAFLLMIFILVIVYGVVIILGLLGHLLSYFRKSTYKISLADCADGWRDGLKKGYLVTWEFLTERCPQGAIAIGILFVIFFSFMILYSILKISLSYV